MHAVFVKVRQKTTKLIIFTPVKPEWKKLFGQILLGLLQT
jgi:hypothetical protein